MKLESRCNLSGYVRCDSRLRVKSFRLGIEIKLVSTIWQEFVQSIC